MQAVHWNRTSGELSLIDQNMPEVPCDSVLVKVFYSGICGTDLHIMQREFRSADTVILGHEFSGMIEKVGSSVETFKVGDRVAVDPNRPCGSCRFCKRGQPNFCPKVLRAAVGIYIDGGWSNYCVVHYSHVSKIPESLSLQKAALSEPFSCIARGWDNLGTIQDDAKILILGAGVIGLLWACLFHHHGYRDVIVTELADGRRRVAADLGLGYQVLHPNDILKQYAGVDTSDEGFDVIVDCTGAPKAIESAFPLLRSGAKMCLFGCCPSVSQITINPADIMLKELTIVGSQVNPYTFPRAVGLVNNMADRYLDFERLGIAMFSLENYDHAIEKLKDGAIAKAMFCLAKE